MSDSEASLDEQLDKALAKLQNALAWIDLMSDGDGEGLGMRLLIVKLELIELRMNKEANHGRPHFHLEYKEEHDASYAVDSFVRLAGMDAYQV